MRTYLVVILTLFLFSSLNAVIIKSTFETDTKKVRLTTQIILAENKELIDISTDRDGGKNNNKSFGQQPAKDKVIDIPTERSGSIKESSDSQVDQPANDKLIDIPTERDSSKQKQKKPSEPVEEVSPVEVTPVQGMH